MTERIVEIDMTDPEWTGERRAAKLPVVEGLRIRAAIYIQNAPRTPAGKQMQRAADTIEQLYGALEWTRDKLLLLAKMQEAANGPECRGNAAILRRDVKLAEAALSAARDTGGVVRSAIPPAGRVEELETLRRLHEEIRRAIHPLTQQGEDRIWRAAEKACALLDKAEDARTALGRAPATGQDETPGQDHSKEMEGLKHDLGRVMKRENRYLNALLNAEEKLAQNHDSIADLRAEIRSARETIHTALGSASATGKTR